VRLRHNFYILIFQALINASVSVYGKYLNNKQRVNSLIQILLTLELLVCGQLSPSLPCSIKVSIRKIEIGEHLFSHETMISESE
jgi:hypothetical protein